ncbi:MAG: 1-acyl-sn-glycerol-3-phosphate acyltransferase [Cryptosporangiaceae bacterium]|nr:1-acyl-sn-glycerol-3-phosphate acyltransferase [Cryptosporangiaceae bacterium]
MTERGPWRAPVLWRVLLVLARILVPLFCRLRVTGDVPDGLRRGPLLLAGNHIGLFDPIALAAACRARGLAPRIMVTGGIFRTPLAGPAFRHCGHLRVDRDRPGTGEVLGQAIAAIRAGSVLAAYPEGRISQDPGLWPERPRTGLARIALITGATVVPAVQWGAHEVLAWGGAARIARTLLTAVWRRPVVRVHFGSPVPLDGLGAEVPGDAQRAADRITAATIAELRSLRADEPGLPRHEDPTRPLSTARSFPGTPLGR